MTRVEWRLIGLQVVTGLVVAFVRHDLAKQRVAWDSFEQFAVSWVVHTVAVMVLMGIALFPILRFHKFFLGYEHKGFKDEVEALTFYILMTVLVASLCIFFVAQYMAASDD
jgi:hypothetical protein